MRKTLLRWSVSLVLGGTAAALAVESHHPPLVALGIVEALGALLLLPQRTRVVGAGLLFVSLLFAIVHHATSRELPPPAFVVYAAAILVAAERS